jgi:outer membrane immunogenic protein
MGGGQVGCNYQTGAWVWGVEADFDKASTGRSVTQINLPQPPFPGRSAISTTISNDLNWIGSVRGRLGYTMTERWMFYVTGGWADGDTQLTVSSVCPTCAPARFAATGTVRQHGGGIIGWGSEYAIDNRWSLQTETAYFDLGRSSTLPLVYNYGINTSSLVVSTKDRGWMTRVGINYKFY